MNCNDELVTKILGQASINLGMGLEEQRKLRDILYIAMDGYDVLAQEKGLMVSDLEEKIAYYIQVKKLEGLSPLTLKESYRTLMTFADTIRKPINIINKNDIRLYLMQYAQGRKESTVGTLTNRIRTFFQWACDEEIIEKNPCRTIKTPKAPKKEVTYLTSIEMEKLRNACNEVRSRACPKRDRAMIEFFVATGCRLAEVIGIKLSEVNFSNNSVQVLGKGRKYRTVCFSDKAKYHLMEYINDRNDDIDCLFLDYTGTKQLQRRGIQKRFTDLGIIAGIKQSVHPHLFRHTMATSASNSGVNMLTIQKNLGHSSLNTTQVYVNFKDSVAKADYEQRFLV